MKKTLKDTEVLPEVAQIIGAAGYTVSFDQMARELLDIFDRATTPEYVVEQILLGFDPKKILSTYKHKFPEPWNHSKWVNALSGNMRGFKQRNKEITEESNGSLKEAAAMVTDHLKSFNDDVRTAFLVVIMKEGLCPFNFHVSKEGLTIDEVNQIARRDKRAQDFFSMLVGQSGKRFPSIVDEADYIVSLMEGKNRRELVAFVASMSHALKELGAIEREGGSALGFTHPMEAMLRNSLFGGASGRNGVFPFPPPGYLGTSDGAMPYRPHHPDRPEGEHRCACSSHPKGNGPGCECKSRTVDFPEDERTG